jgi:hypothetical protein
LLCDRTIQLVLGLVDDVLGLDQRRPTATGFEELWHWKKKMSEPSRVTGSSVAHSAWKVSTGQLAMLGNTVIWVSRF